MDKILPRSYQTIYIYIYTGCRIFGSNIGIAWYCIEKPFGFFVALEIIYQRRSQFSILNSQFSILNSQLKHDIEKLVKIYVYFKRARVFLVKSVYKK